ncbi:MAG: hypothetical protein ACYS80_14780 [Planctomycetota bacterium]
MPSSTFHRKPFVLLRDLFDDDQNIHKGTVAYFVSRDGWLLVLDMLCCHIVVKISDVEPLEDLLPQMNPAGFNIRRALDIIETMARSPDPRSYWRACLNQLTTSRSHLSKISNIAGDEIDIAIGDLKYYVDDPLSMRTQLGNVLMHVGRAILFYLRL